MNQELFSRLTVGLKTGAVSVAELLSLAAEDFATYCSLVLPKFESATHVLRIIKLLEAVETGELKRLILSCPPRHGKTKLVAELFTSWFLGRHPQASVILASYAEDLATDTGRRVRNICADATHRAIFPACVIAEDSSSVKRFNTAAGGSFFAVGKGGAISGRGADLFVCDDLLRGHEEAGSQTIRRAMKEWFQSVAFTRLEPLGRILIIGTRWHEDDLQGWLLREDPGEGWRVLNMPAIAEVGDQDRKVGQALWPERYPLEELEGIRQTIGGRAWESLYQGRPTAAEGQIFLREWWQYYDAPPASFTKIVLSLDTAFKKGTSNDYSVCTVWGAAPEGYYLLGCQRARLEFPELKRKVQEQAALWRPHAVLIEDAASGQSLIQELKSTALPVLPQKVDSDKISRAQSVTPLVESGRVRLPRSAGWLADFVDELAAFPNGTHDDQVDSLSMALNYFRGGNDVFGVLEYYKGLATGVYKLPEETTPAARAEQARAIAEAAKLIRQASRPQAPAPLCPKCGSAAVSVFGRMHRCADCQHAWMPGPTTYIPNRRDILEGRF